MGYISVKKANCKNCYKCLKYCAVKSISYINERVEVIDDQCVLCGMCINVCPQKAKTVQNDPQKIVKLLQDPSKRVVASLAPSYIGVYGEQNRNRLTQALLKLGFDSVEETAVGANEVTRQYAQFVAEGTMPCMLTTCCPSVNELIQKYYPELVSYMLPVVSPVVAHGRMIKQQLGADTVVVFIGPCLSKMKEIDLHPESVDGSLSFRMLDILLQTYGIRIEDMEDATPEFPEVYSRIYPVPDGIVRDIQKQLKVYHPNTDNSYQFLQVSGLNNVMNFLDELKKEVPPRVFVELNSCEGGCINGPLIPDERRAEYRGRLEIEKYAKDKQPVSCAAVFPETCASFEPIPFRQDIPDESVIRKILSEIGKSTPDKELNCGSCGYATCRDKAIAVYQKKAELYMCLPYINELSQSLSNVTLSVSPDYIVAVDRDLRIVEMNPAALNRFGVTRDMAVKADLYEFMDPSDFEEVLSTHRNIHRKKVRLKPLDIITLQTLVYVPEQDIVMGFIKDITEEEKKKNQLFRDRKDSADMAQKVIEKQMIVAQEIASLLGETTAETKVTLNKLKTLLINEGGDS